MMYNFKIKVIIYLYNVLWYLIVLNHKHHYQLFLFFFHNFGSFLCYKTMCILYNKISQFPLEFLCFYNYVLYSLMIYTQRINLATFMPLANILNIQHFLNVQLHNTHQVFQFFFFFLLLNPPFLLITLLLFLKSFSDISSR